MNFTPTKTRIALLALAALALVGWQQGGTSTRVRWEHSCAEVPANRMNDHFRSLVNERWEMVGFESMGDGRVRFCYKRQR